MKILGVKFASLNVSLERSLQILTVAGYISLQFFGYFMLYILAAYFLFYTQIIRYVMLLYFVWIYYDWDTCNRGGRSSYLLKWARDNVFWRYFCNYFPLKLVKTVDLNPMKSYLFINVPHGLFCMGIMGCFASDVMDCRKLFPGMDIRVIVLNQHFFIPFMREFVYFWGTCSPNARSIEYLISTPPEKPDTGRITIIIIGGAAEAMESRPGVYRTLINKRKGFVKLALKHGTPLVPVFSFGEPDLYNQLYYPEGSIVKRIQHYIRSIIKLPFIVFWGRGFFQYSFGLIPRRSPVTVVVGHPIELPKIENPTTEQIDEYHKKFNEGLINLFETHKHKYMKNAETTTLEFC